MDRIYEDERIVLDLDDITYIEKVGCGYRVWLSSADDSLTFDACRGGYVLSAWKAYVRGDEEVA